MRTIEEIKMELNEARKVLGNARHGTCARAGLLNYAAALQWVMTGGRHENALATENKQSHAP